MGRGPCHTAWPSIFSQQTIRPKFSMKLLAQDFKNSGTAIAWAVLRDGASALDAIEQGVRAVESNPVDQSVGLGGHPNAAGEVELDAGVMDGRTRASGAVGALKGFAHPVSVAYAVMRKLPHVLLVGEGAARFATEIGAERGELLTEETRQAWQRWAKECGLPKMGPETALMEAVNQGKDPWHTAGTTIYLAQDSKGDIAAATSTSGWAWKYPGRLGDSPIAGAGFYADNRYGAAACTGMGELSIRTGLARITVHLLRIGMRPAEAVQEALGDIAILAGPRGNLTLCAIDAKGEHAVLTIRQHKDPVPYCVASDGDEKPVYHEAKDFVAVE
jgi:L-asparaginase / beta-aspartyl-peptidase